MVSRLKNPTLDLQGVDRSLLATVARSFASEFDRLTASMAAPTATDRRERVGLLDWSRHFLPDHFIKPPSALHSWLADRCDEFRFHRGRKVNVIGPRGGAKSTIGTMAHPIRCALDGTEPLIWIVSETDDQAEDFLLNIRIELESNEAIRREYGSVAGKGPVWRDSKLQLRNGVVIAAFGVGRKIRGRKHRQNRPSLIIADDLQGDNCTVSTNARDKGLSWFNSALMNAGNKRTNYIHLATAIHRDAIGMRLNLPGSGWQSRVFRAIERWPDNMHLWEQWADIRSNLDDEHREAHATEFFESNAAAMQAGSQLLWPEEEDLLTLMAKRQESGRSAFEREKQSRPVNPETCEWPESYFDDHIWFDDWPKSSQVKTLALDPSKGKDAKRSDYSAFVMLQVSDGVLYVDANLERRPTPQIIQDGVALYRSFRPDAFGVEANQFQELLGGEFDAEFTRQGVLGVTPHMLTNTMNKLVRIRTLGPWLEQKRIRLKQGSPGAMLLLSQLKDFPDSHSHDDGPDALEMAIRLAAMLLDPQAATTEIVRA